MDMRRLLILLGAATALCGAVAANGAATAGDAPKAYVCWTAVGGFTDCDWLPVGYRIPGFKRATCYHVRHDSDRSKFVLTGRRIAALAAQGVRTDTMAPGAWTEIQAVCKKHR
jgi:hypothetical protein